MTISFQYSSYGRLMKKVIFFVGIEFLTAVWAPMSGYARNPTRPLVLLDLLTVNTYPQALSFIRLMSLIASCQVPQTESFPQKSFEAEEIVRRLTGEGWRLHFLTGSTGSRHHRSQDSSGVVAYHPEGYRAEGGREGGDLLILAFHGTSRSEDWKANIDFFPKRLTPRSAEFSIWAHGGYVRDFHSFQTELTGVLDQILRVRGSHSRPLKILVTGHSKGGAIGSIVAPFIQNRFDAYGVQVGLLTFSTQRVFYGASSKHWVEATLGDNILRIQAEWDVIPFTVPAPIGFKSVGRVIVSSHVATHSPADHLSATSGSSRLLSGSRLLAHHFVSPQRNFDPSLVPSFRALEDSLRQWRQEYEPGLSSCR